MIDARSNSLSIGSRHNKPFIVIVCLITLMAFLVNTCSCNLAWADRTPSELTSVGSDRAVSPVSPGLFKELKAKTFVLPQSLGMVKDAYSAHSGAATVIQIQDAHCNYGAQKKIADIISYVSDNYGISSINLEGGAGKYDLTVFTDIPDKRIREKTADYFVREGLINGAEYFAINNPDKAVLLGIEDPKLYIENLKVYRNSLLYKEDVESSLKSLSYILTNLKIKIYSKELLEFDTKYSRFKADNMEFKDYLVYLLGEAKAKSIDIKPYNNIALLSRAQAAESAIDFNKANNERDELIDILHKKLSKNALEDLVAKTVEFKKENIAQKDFYDYLVEKAGKLNIDLKSLPELSKYIGYISLYEAMDKTKVMDESDLLESKIKDAMFENDGQRDLARLSKNLVIMKNIFNVSLTRDDYRYYKAHEGEFAIDNYQRFIRDNASRYHLNAVLWPNIDKIDQYREDISKFYEYSFKRDEAFLRNITYDSGSSSMVNRQKPAATILITGGFHTDNLCDMFKKKGISYITILPNFASDKGYESPYFTLLSGREKVMVEKLSTIISSALMQIASMLSELGPDAWGEDGVNAFKAAVRIQSLIFEGKSVRITGKGLPDEGILFGDIENKDVVHMTVDDLKDLVKSGAPAIAPAAAAATAVTPAQIIKIIDSWKYADLDGAEIGYVLDEKTISQVLDIARTRSETIKGSPAILAKLCFIYEHSSPEVAEKNVEDWLNAYDKPYVFTAPKANEIERPLVENLSWSAFFDFMNTKVRDPSSLSLVPYLEYAIKKGISNVEIPFDFLPFGFAARLAEEIPDTEINDIKKICEEYGLTITIHSPLVGPLNSKTQYKQFFEDAADNISMMQKQIEVAGRMGAKMMVVHLSNPEKIDEYAGLVLYARANAPGLKIVFENYQDKKKAFPSAEDFMKAFTGIVDKVNARDKDALNNVGIVIDTAHYNLTGREDPIVSSFIIAARVKELAAKYGIEAKGLLAELHVNQNMGPISFYGRGFSADIHANASLEGPINNQGIISMLTVMGYDPHMTLEQMSLPDDGDIHLLDSARNLARGKNLAEVETAGNTIMKTKDYRAFLKMQVADPSMLDEAYKAYRILAGLIGARAFEAHVQRRIYQKILTVKSEAEFNSLKANLQEAGLMGTELDGVSTKQYAENEVIIKQGAIVDPNRSDLDVLYIILEGGANGKIVVTDERTGRPIVVDFEVKPGNFVGEMAVITEDHERMATIVSRAGTVALVLTMAVIKDIRRLMPNFASLMKTYKEMRDEQNEARITEAAAEATAPIAAQEEAREGLLKRFEAFKDSAREGDWVVKFDGPRIGATNDMYGREATDWFVAEIIKQTVIDFAVQNNIPAEVGGKGSEEFAFAFPATLSENGIRIEMDKLMQMLKEKCDSYRVITLNAKLNADQIATLRNEVSAFVYSVGIESQEKGRTKVIFDKSEESNIINLLGPRGQALSEGLRVPYPVTAITRLGANNDFREAYLMAGRWQEQYKNTPIEDGGELLIFGPPAFKTEKEKAQVELDVSPERRSEIENAISGYVSSLSTDYAVEKIYGVYHRDSLGRLLEDLHAQPLSDRTAGTYLIRGPPNEFYVVDVKAGGSFELVKFDTLFFARPGANIAELFNEIGKNGRISFKIKDDTREMFGFKAINTVFGHTNGDFVIKAIRYSLDKAFVEHPDASLEEKAAVAAVELNRLFNGSGFGCFIMTSQSTEGDAANDKEYKYFANSAITKVDDLIRARDVLIHKEISSGYNDTSIVKRSLDYESLKGDVANNLELSKYHKMIAGEAVIKDVDADLTAKAQSLHEVVGRIPFDIPLELILLSGNYPPGIYRTEVTVGEGTVTIAEYDKDGIVMGTIRTLSAGGSETIIARVGEGDILLQAPGRITETYSAGTYRTQVIVHEGFVSVQTYDESGAVTGDKVFLRIGQNASIVVKITGITSPTYQEELAAKGVALEEIKEPPVPGAGSVTGWDSIGYFNILDRFGGYNYSDKEKTEAHLAQMGFWFGTNETDWDASLGDMSGRSGAYLGIAYGGQNLSRLSQGNFDKAIIIDSNPFVTEIFMPIRAALTAQAGSRAEYLGFLAGVRLDVNELKKLKDAPLREIADYILVKAKDEGDDAAISFREDTWGRIHGQFPDELQGPAERFWNDYAPRKFGFSQMVEAMNVKGSWLASEENFGKIQKMLSEGKIIGITGSWTDEDKMKNVAKYMDETGLKASVVYDSNITEWIYKIVDPVEKDKAIKARINNLHRLPITDDAIFLDVNASGKTAIIRNIPVSEGGIAKPAEVPAAPAQVTELAVDDADTKIFEAIVQIFRNVTSMNEPRIFFIPVKDTNLAPYHTTRGDIKYHLEEQGFKGIEIRLYDGTKNDLDRAYSDYIAKNTGVEHMALAYVDAGEIDHATLKEHNEKNSNFKWIRENVPDGVPVNELFLHIAFGLPVLDYAANPADPDRRQTLSDIIEKLADKESKNIGMLKADINNLFVADIILKLKALTKIDINAEMHSRQKSLEQILTAV